MIVNNYVKNVIILDSNPGLQQEVKKFFDSIKINTIKATGKLSNAISFAEADDTKADLIVIDTKIEDGTALELLPKILEHKLLCDAHLILVAEKDVEDIP